jgi:Uma2 family endonuclease
MATNPTHSESSWSWPDKGGVMSEEEYHELQRLNPDRKYEYVAGMAYMMSGGSVGHDRLTRTIGFLLDQRLSGPCTAFGPDVQVLLGIKKNGRKHFVYPDATVSCNATDNRSDNLLIESPRIVVEVLSPGTEAKDRGAKFKAYQNCPTIQEIVLVSQFAQYIEIWQRDELDTTQWHYRHYGPGETVAFASIDIHVAIEDLYRGLNFTLASQDEE